MSSKKSIYRSTRDIYRIVRSELLALKRRLTGVDKKTINRYFQSNATYGLHIGCGHNHIPHFINSDISPTSSEIIRIDATRTLPFQDNSLDYIFSEHMIEHLSHGKGLHMLRECRRVLKVGGTIRISTPDLARIAALSREDLTDLESRYVAWSNGKFLPSVPSDDPTFVVNNFFRDWGHQFIYTRRTLSFSMKQCGFTNIVSCRLNESSIKALRGLENESRMPEGFLAFETFTLEATNPG